MLKLFRARSLTSHQLTKELIETTTTKKGLVLGQWNYVVTKNEKMKIAEVTT